MKKAKLREHGLNPELPSTMASQRVPVSTSGQAFSRALAFLTPEYRTFRQAVGSRHGIASIRVWQQGRRRSEFGRWMRTCFPGHTKGRNLFLFGDGSKIDGNYAGLLRGFATTKMPVAVESLSIVVFLFRVRFLHGVHL